MVDIKYFKPVASDTSGTATEVGSFPAAATPGASVGTAVSPSGVLYVAQIASDGSIEVTLSVDNEATITAPVGTFPLGVYRATPTSYSDGDATVLQTSLNGNLKVQGTRYISSTTLRSAAVLTNSYVTSTSIPAFVEGENQLILLVDATLGSLTSIEIRVDFSDDDATFYQETFGSISGGIDILTLGEHQITADGLYRIPIPVADQYVRIAAKGTGTVTSSSLEIMGVLSAI